MKAGSLALVVVALSNAIPGHGIRPAVALEFCVELTASEFNHRAERRGDDNACAGAASGNVKATARDRARDNANNAIASRCLNGVSLAAARQACRRVNLAFAPSSGRPSDDVPPSSKPDANKVQYIGRGIGSAAGVRLCAMAHDMRIGTHNVVDGHCPHNSGLLPHRTFATARAWARCAVVCGVPQHSTAATSGHGRE